MTRAFEPERNWPDAIESGDAEQFVDRELGVLGDQGNFEQARQKLVRKVMARGDDPDVYLDAIRLERSAAPSGTAWEAWAVSALSHRVQIAAGLLLLLPRAVLAAFVAKKRVRWGELEQQQDLAVAHELMRLRLAHQLENEPESALTALEDPAFVRCAQEDPTLRRFALGVMAGVVWLEFARVRALAPQYGVDWNAQPDARDPDATTRARLLLAFRLRPEWVAVTAEVPCPAALERVVRLAPLTSTVQAERLAHELSADLRAQRREYLRCADCVARSSRPLANDWLDSIRALRDELAAKRAASAAALPAAAPQARVADPQQAVLERCMVKLRSELRSDPLQRVWWGVVGLSTAGCAWLGASRVLGLHAFQSFGSFGLWLGVSLLPLRRMIDALLYQRDVRPVAFEATATHGISLAALVEHMRQAALPRRNALAARAARDPGLSLLSAIAELAAPSAHTTGQVRS